MEAPLIFVVTLCWVALALAYPKDLRRILVVSNGSTDFTDAVADLFAAGGVDLLRITAPRRSPTPRSASRTLTRPPRS